MRQSMTELQEELREQDIDRIADRVVTKALRYLIAIIVASIVGRAFLDATVFGDGVVSVLVAIAAMGAALWATHWLLERKR